jgi:hypothetical protein
MTAWPVFLPCILVEGYGYQRKDLALRTEFETGRVRMRRRFSDGPAQVQASCLMTQEQFAYFEGWWLHTIAAGTAPFTVPLAVGLGAGIDHECRYLGPYSVSGVQGQLYKVDMQLLATKPVVLDAGALALADAYGGIDALDAFLDALDAFVNGYLPGSPLGV